MQDSRSSRGSIGRRAAHPTRRWRCPPSRVPYFNSDGHTPCSGSHQNTLKTWRSRMPQSRFLPVRRSEKRSSTASSMVQFPPAAFATRRPQLPQTSRKKGFCPIPRRVISTSPPRFMQGLRLLPSVLGHQEGGAAYPQNPRSASKAPTFPRTFPRMCSRSSPGSTTISGFPAVFRAFRRTVPSRSTMKPRM